MTSEFRSASAVGSGLEIEIAAGTPSTEFAGYVSASAVEEQLTAHAELMARASVVYIDLSRALHFETSGLLRLLSIVAERQLARKHTRFRLPNDPPARHILRLWRFPRALSAITHTPFRLLVGPDDWIYFGEEWPQPRVSAEAASARASVLAYLVERRSFGLATYQVEGALGVDRVVQEQTGHWSGYALASLLATVLAVPATDFARVVVHELLANVLLIARPVTVIVGSQLDLVQHSEIGAPSGLTIAVWHDGKPVIDQFRAAIGDLRLPKGATAEGSEGAQAVSAGFTALCRTSIQTFGGSVEVRGKSSSLLITQAGGRVIATQLSTDLTPMLGDIVTVRLPIRDA